VHLRNLPVSIRQQSQRKLVLLREPLVRFDRVRRYPNDLGTRRLILRPMVTHRAKLRRANRRVVAWIKQQHDRASFVITQRPLVAVTVRESELRSGFSYFHMVLRKFPAESSGRAIYFLLSPNIQKTAVI